VDIYFRREYVEASALLEPGLPVLLHLSSAGGDVAFPFILRDVDGGRTDVITPYGYGGPLSSGPEAPVDLFWDEYERWCAANGVVTTFVRFHPLLGNQRTMRGHMHVEPLGETIAWRLDGDLFTRMHRHHRRLVRKAEAAGVESSASVAPPSLDRFVQLYELTMERKDAAGFYYFRPEYWRALESGLRERIVLFEAGEDASLLCLATPPWLHYHLGASSEAARKRGANNLLFYEAARWAAAEGYTHFHLGGGVGGRADSLFDFKRRFDPDGALEMAIGKAVHDEDAYRALAGDDAGLEGFFPAYRGRPSTVSA
jgi:serine/alanine adding enzyme